MPITFLTATEKIKKSRKKEKQLVTNVDVLFLCSNLVTQENKKKKKKWPDAGETTLAFALCPPCSSSLFFYAIDL